MGAARHIRPRKMTILPAAVFSSRGRRGCACRSSVSSQENVDVRGARATKTAGKACCHVATTFPGAGETRCHLVFHGPGAGKAAPLDPQAFPAPGDSVAT